MTVNLDNTTIRLEGDCHIEDAEPLLNLLQGGIGRAVDVSALGAMHTAVLQLLLAFQPKVVGQEVSGTNVDRFFDSWIAPLLARAGNG